MLIELIQDLHAWINGAHTTTSTTSTSAIRCDHIRVVDNSRVATTTAAVAVATGGDLIVVQRCNVHVVQRIGIAVKVERR